MGNTEGNSATQSTISMPRQDVLKIGEHGSSYPPNFRPQLASLGVQQKPNIANGFTSFPTKFRGEILSVRKSSPSSSSSQQSQDNPICNPVDLTIEKRNSQRYGSRNLLESKNQVNQTTNTGVSNVSNSSIKLKFGIDSILNASAISDVSRRSPKSIKIDLKNNENNHISEAHVEVNNSPQSASTTGSVDPERFSGHLQEQYPQLHAYKEKIETEKHFKSQISFHPYCVKQRPSHQRNPSDPQSSSFHLSVSTGDERWRRRRSESPRPAKISGNYIFTAAKNGYSEKKRTSSLQESNCTAAADSMFLQKQSGSLAYKPGGNVSPLSPPLRITVRPSSLNYASEDKPVKTHVAVRDNSVRPMLNSLPVHLDTKPLIDVDHSNLNSESDDVFDDDCTASKRSLPSSQYEMLWRRYSVHPKKLLPDTRDALRSAKHSSESLQCYRSPQSVSSACTTSPSFAIPSPTLHNQLSLHAWQAMAANYHPNLPHFVYPYSYGPAAAVAMAAMRTSLKSMTLPPMGLAESLSVSKNSGDAFRLQGVASSQQSYNGEKVGGPRKRRKWSRAVFSLMQRRGLEKSFQMQKYVAKPERRGLAEALGLTDAQVKIWFQNRRMKWRQEQKSNSKTSISDGEETSPRCAEDPPPSFNSVIANRE
ncbi:uncharacterized protein LOC143462932 [Clavelina lepadiformis]|uniref:uncharacterized protein LOC143462932 n=1 Tax=Clavelina lepadiformis TaxID=159417 RepID=UPI00404369C6